MSTQTDAQGRPLDSEGYPIERGIPHPVDYAKLRVHNVAGGAATYKPPRYCVQIEISDGVETIVDEGGFNTASLASAEDALERALDRVRRLQRDPRHD